MLELKVINYSNGKNYFISGYEVNGYLVDLYQFGSDIWDNCKKDGDQRGKELGEVIARLLEDKDTLNVLKTMEDRLWNMLKSKSWSMKIAALAIIIA